MTHNPSVLITGCSSGIGRHCALRLRDDGYRVFATARKPEDLGRLRDEGMAAALHLDYREPDSIRAAFAAVMAETGGRLDALVNNGAYSQPGAVEDLPTDALREQFEANFFGWHELTRLAVPVMRGQGGGRIVHVSSILGLVPAPVRGAYVASKHALEGLMLTARMELEGSGVHMSLIEPGPVPSKIAQNALAYAHKYIDIEASVHRAAYEKRLAELEAGGTPDDGGRAAGWVYRRLRHALKAAKPRPHYLVTPQARLGVAGKWLLPAGLFYRIVAART
ncbi:SDR family NAD(P)-dependent oxidoreductase [Oricola thermophila]|uniref:SDR family NAD(P)-dependent oxidoreductase n=1 Tax=Oricola thermophila TaxID=2742145 RepID=A0A6N1VMS1_9HYPH|nr:SDR family NAD(P)-dependent oxidoreductase [Oricola thermophila]QKV20287.1 SDR family NAD(P)-dependent oxidoreductase [Oricola thermophila]